MLISYVLKNSKVLLINFVIHAAVTKNTTSFMYIFSKYNVLINNDIVLSRAAAKLNFPFFFVKVDKQLNQSNNIYDQITYFSASRVFKSLKKKRINKYLSLLGFKYAMLKKYKKPMKANVYYFFKLFSYVKFFFFFNKKPLLRFEYVKYRQAVGLFWVWKSKKYKLCWEAQGALYKDLGSKLSNKVIILNQNLNLSFSKKNDDMPFSNLKNYLMLFIFFFKIKKFSFFNAFFNLICFLPIELVVDFLKLKKIDVVQPYLLKFKQKYIANLWSLFFIDYSIILKKKMFFLTFFYIFITKYLEFLCGARVCLRLKNFRLNLNIFNNLLDWLARRMSIKLKQFNRFFFYKEFLEILILSLWKKDIKFFELWLIRFLEKIHFKYHKNFFFLLKLFFKDFFKKFQQIFLLKGLKFDIRGKVSVSGNAKKRSYLVTYGKYSVSTKFNKISFTKNIVRTSTGVLGIELLLVY